MTDEFKEIRKRILGKEFRQFYQETLFNDIKGLERVRIYYLICINIVLVFSITYLLIALIYIYTQNAEFSILIIALLIILLTFNLLIVQLSCKTYKTKAKKIVLVKLLNFIGNFSIEDNKDDRSYIQSLKLFDRFNEFSCDDRIKGTYNSIPIDIQELSLVYESGSGRNKRRFTIFNGVFIKTKSLKQYTGYTVIKRKLLNNALNLNILEDKPKVYLEDPTFNQYYNVYSNDQVEARYLITASFIERMTALSNQNISLSFENNNINIGIHSTKDWFEVPILKPANDINNYRNILIQLINILSIINTLKLQQAIGI